MTATALDTNAIRARAYRRYESGWYAFDRLSQEAQTDLMTVLDHIDTLAASLTTATERVEALEEYKATHHYSDEYVDMLHKELSTKDTATQPSAPRAIDDDEHVDYDALYAEPTPGEAEDADEGPGLAKMLGVDGLLHWVNENGVALCGQTHFAPFAPMHAKSKCNICDENFDVLQIDEPPPIPAPTVATPTTLSKAQRTALLKLLDGSKQIRETPAMNTWFVRLDGQRCHEGNIRRDVWRNIKQITPAVVEKIGPVPTYPQHTLWQLTPAGIAALAATDARTDGGS